MFGEFCLLKQAVFAAWRSESELQTGFPLCSGDVVASDLSVYWYLAHCCANENTSSVRVTDKRNPIAYHRRRVAKET